MRLWLRAGTLVVVAGSLVALGVAVSRDAGESGPGKSGHGIAAARPGGAVQLVAYRTCAQMLDDLRAHAAANAGQWNAGTAPVPGVGAAQSAGEANRASAAPTTPTPDHSTTTAHEPGVDEPDIVKTDGRRVVTVQGGTLRVVDTAARRVTGSIGIPGAYPGASPELFLDRDRALVIVPDVMSVVPGRQLYPTDPVQQPRTSFVLVDISAAPRVLGSLTVGGQFVDARLVGDTARLVARTQPPLAFPPIPGGPGRPGPITPAQQARTAPLSAWLPSYQVRDGGPAVTHTVGCGQVSHPSAYTGTSMLTIYSIDLARGVSGIAPVSLAADGDVVYGTSTSLYVASNPQWWALPLGELPRGGVGPKRALPSPKAQQTSVHRFDITGSGQPRYVASGTVPGRLLNQYSLSEYAGYLRVATTTGTVLDGQASGASSAVYELNATTMARAGVVGGLGHGQRIYAVRFVGPVGYVVTFRQMDPLYTLDLRDPSAPRVAGSLELSGYSAYLSPAGDGRLIGVGQEANAQGQAQGLQVSLFDVHDPAHPTQLARVVEPQTQSMAEYDPHAFLYWPPTGTLVLPVNSWSGGTFAASALVLKVTGSTVATAGRIDQQSGAAQSGISRALVIGGSLWTLSSGGLQVSDAASLSPQAWVPLS